MNPMADDAELVLAPAVGRVDRLESTTLTTRMSTLELEGESLSLVREVLDLLDAPRTRAAVTAALPHHDPELVGEVLELLLDRDILVHAPAAGRVWQAARRGVRLVGEGAVARALGRALAGTGLPVCATADAGPVAAGELAVSVSSSLFDARVLQVDRGCRATGAAHVPVIVDGAVAHVGPLVAPWLADGPCARCALLRLVAMRHLYLFELWRDAIDDPTVLAHADGDEALAALVAPQLLAFLRSVADDGSAGIGVVRGPSSRARAHALVRVDRTGLADFHRVQRHAHCSACRTAPPRFAALPAGALAEGAARTEAVWRAHLADHTESLAPSQPMVEDFADPVTGLISLAEEWTQRSGYFNRFPVLWGGINLVRDREWVTTELQGINGTGPTLDHRRLVCASEGAERYAQYTHQPAVTHARYVDVRDHAVDPRELVLYTDEQYAQPGFPRRPFDERTPLWWSWGYDLVSGRARLLPTEWVAANLADEGYPERLIDQRLTSGGASHTSWHRALRNCVRELIERDAHMIAWYKRIPLPTVQLGERVGDPYADELLAFLRSVGMELRVLDLRMDFPIPTYLMVGRLAEKRGSWDAGGAVFVAVADLDPMEALSRGLCETALHWETLCLTPSARKEWRNNPYDKDDPGQGWRGWWPIYMHYLNPAHVERTSFLWSSEERVELSALPSFGTGDPVADVDVFVKLFRERGLSAWAFDLVNDDTAELGFRVTKVQVPGLIDLTPGFQSRRLRTPRLDQVAKRLGRPCLPPGVTQDETHPNA